MKVEVRRTFDHYTVYIDGEFYCTAENRREADEEIKAYMEEVEHGLAV